MKVIYEKEIECDSNLAIVKIEEEAYYICSATLNREMELLKEKRIKSATLGHLPIKITLKIESE